MQFFNKNGKPARLTVAHDNVVITESKVHKFLGVILDTHLSWKEHVESVCQKINRFIYALYRLRNICDQTTALTAYHGFVCSTLRYGIVMWGNSVDMSRAFILQKKCVRAMCGAGPLDSCRPMFKSLNLLTLPSLYIFESCMFVKKNQHLFPERVVTFSTRYPNRLMSQPHRTTCFSRNSLNMCIKLFNVLPRHIRVLPLTMFKKWLFLFL